MILIAQLFLTGVLIGIAILFIVAFFYGASKYDDVWDD